MADHNKHLLEKLEELDSRCRDIEQQIGNPAVAYRDDLTGDARLTYVPAEVREVFAPIIRR